MRTRWRLGDRVPVWTRDGQVLGRVVELTEDADAGGQRARLQLPDGRVIDAARRDENEEPGR